MISETVSNLLMLPNQHSHQYNAFGQNTQRKATLGSEEDWDFDDDYANNRSSNLSYDAEGNALAAANLNVRTFMKKIILICVNVVVVVWLALPAGYAQQRSQDRVVTALKPRGCERNNVVLELANEEAGIDSVLVLIGRPGIKDKRKDITEKRLYTAAAYLVKYLSNSRTEKSTITGQSQNIGNEYGILEIYVKGKLFDVLASSPDFEIGLGSCDSLESDDEKRRAKRALLYPWLYRKEIIK